MGGEGCCSRSRKTVASARSAGRGGRDGSALCMRLLAGLMAILACSLTAPAAELSAASQSADRVMSIAIRESGAIALDGDEIGNISLRQAIAAACGGFAPSMYVLDVDPDLECRWLDYFLREIRAGHQQCPSETGAYIRLAIRLPGSPADSLLPIPMPSVGRRQAPMDSSWVSIVKPLATGRFSIAGRDCSQDSLQRCLSEDARSTLDRAVLLDPEPHAKCARVVQVIDVCRQLGLHCLSLWGDLAWLEMESEVAYRSRHTWQPPLEVAELTGVPALVCVDYFSGWPEPILKVAPAYPDSAYKAEIKGETMLLVLVDEKGEPYNVQVLQSELPEDLEKAAVDAAWQWRFKPARDRRGPIRSAISIPFVFPPLTRAR